MHLLRTTGRIFYGVAMVAMAFQQFFYGDIRPVFVPPSWPHWLHAYAIWAYLLGLGLVMAGLFIILNKKVEGTALYVGWLLLAMLVFFHVPYVLFVGEYSAAHLGLWTDALKELALSGGAFIIAGTFSPAGSGSRARLANYMEKIIPPGNLFFCSTMVSFGIAHFLYTEHIVKIVPGWVYDPIFWTYLAGVALIGSGVAIILKIRVRTIAILLGIMLLLWCILLHLPRAVADPFGMDGNEITSAFQSLGFSGIAFLIAYNDTAKYDL